MRRKANHALVELIRHEGESRIGLGTGRRRAKLRFVPVDDPTARRAFDHALDEVHYAGSCQRVGRCMRLALTNGREWVGGVVLGSTFPNMAPRDDAFGLTKFIHDTRRRGLISPFAAENRLYWDSLQKIVNHARTFIFPAFQGEGLGIEAHSLLLKEGRQIWQERYDCDVHGFDTLCTHPGSRLFCENGWSLVGRTKGYTRDPETALSSRRAFADEWRGIEENAGLAKLAGSARWWIWVIVFQQF